MHSSQCSPDTTEKDTETIQYYPWTISSNNFSHDLTKSGIISAFRIFIKRLILI